MDALRNLMEAKYCPPLDTSLLAAIFADEEEDCKAKNLSKPTDQRIDELHDILSELSANAVEDSGDGSDPSPQFNGAFSDPPRSAWSSDDTPDWSSGDATTSSSEASNLNFPQFAFLQTAFPHIDTAKLRAVAIALGGPDGSPDMEDVIEEVLNREHRRECQERGIDVDTFLDGRQKNNPRVESASAKRKGGMKLVINDVRQQHHYSAGSGLGGPSRDPWTRSISLSTHLATLIPSCNPEYFQSAFHNPQHSSPCMALRYTLQKINDGPSPGNGELSEQETQYLFEMFDALRASPVYETMSVGQRDQLLSDARLSLRATNNEPNAAWELISIILDLERDLDVGIYHSAPATPLSPTILSPTSPIPKSRPNSSQWATSGSIMTSPTSPTPKSDTLGGDWNYIPERPKNEPRYLANSIPAYDPNRKARIKGVGRGRGDICEHSPMRRIAELHRNRNKVLREATRYWKGGNAGNRGGEVAQYFAERARDAQIQAKAEELAIVRDMVNGTRRTVNGHAEVDLHGATVAEATQIVEEMIYDDPPTNAKPLKIITGRGKHSVNGVSVLRPALKKRLSELGWDITLFDGGLIVRGRL